MNHYNFWKTRLKREYEKIVLLVNTLEQHLMSFYEIGIHHFEPESGEPNAYEQQTQLELLQRRELISMFSQQSALADIVYKQKGCQYADSKRERNTNFCMRNERCISDRGFLMCIEAPSSFEQTLRDSRNQILTLLETNTLTMNAHQLQELMRFKDK